MKLTDLTIRNTKPGLKPKKLFDGRGMFLLINPSGTRLWRFKYRFSGKEQSISLGPYPEVSLLAARERREEARRLLAEDVNPSRARKEGEEILARRRANTFERIAREWYAQKQPSWVEDHANRLLRRLEQNVFPWLGNQPIDGIRPTELLAVLRRMQDRDVIESAHRAMSTCSQVFRYAVATGRAERDITTDLRGALPPKPTRHRAAVVDPDRFGGLIRLLYNYPGGLIVRTALKMQCLTFVRPGELRTARWQDIDLAKANWSFIVSKTKTPLIVPLARQAVDLLQELHPLTSSSEFVFPGRRSTRRPMSSSAVLAAMRAVGISKDVMCGHGFRASARTLLCEELGFRAELVEQQLSHVVRDPLGRAYNRTHFLNERREMMQAWADYINGKATELSSEVTWRKSA